MRIIISYFNTLADIITVRNRSILIINDIFDYKTNLLIKDDYNGVSNNWWRRDTKNLIEFTYVQGNNEDK